MRFQNDTSPVFCEGDARYMSAEVLQEHATCKADVFSLGMMMFEVSLHVMTRSTRRNLLSGFVD